MKKSCVCILLITCMLLAFVGCGCKHAYSEEWSADDTHHWHACTGEDCSEQSDRAEHTWDEGAVTLLPTATTNGVRKYTCTVCGKTRTESVVANTTVSIAEWANAFLMQEENYIMTVATLTQGNLLVQKRGQLAMACDPQAADGKESYFAVEGEKYYCYDKTKSGVTKQEIQKQEYQNRVTLIGLQGLVQSSFTYNESTKMYEAQQLTLDGVLYTNVRLSFLNGRIEQISFVKKEQGKADDVYNINVTYGTVATDIVLPQVTQ